MNVRFFAGTKAQYLSLPVPRNPLGLYFCEDTKELFWADRLLTDGTRIVSTFADLPSREKAAEGITYFVEETRNGYVLSSDRTDWVQVIYAPATESSVKAISFAGIEMEEVDGVFTIDRRCAREALGFKVPEGMEDEEFEIASTDYVTKAISAIEIPEVPTKVSELENDAKYATEQFVADAIANQVPVDELAKKEEVLEVKTTIKEEVLPKVEKVDEIEPTVSELKTWVENKEYLQDIDLEGYATEEFVTKKIAEAELADQDIDLSAYYTKSETEAAIKSAVDAIDVPDVSNLATKEELEAVQNVAGSNSVKLMQLDSDLVDINAKLETIPSIEGLATETYVDEKFAAINIPDVSNFITMEEVEAKGYINEVPAEYITENELEAKGYLTEHQDLSHLAEKDHVHAEYAAKEHEHDQYLTEHQDLSEYAKKSDIPEDETFVIDFNAPDFAAALDAYNNGKLLLLTNAAPDTNSYAVVNYVREDLITFTKFLMSRSGTYGSFNTYYLHNDNTWELAKEVKLNKVEANVSDEPVAELSTVRIGKEVYSIPSTEGLASIEYVDTAIAGIEIPESEKVDLTGYATEIYVDTKLAEVKVPTKVSELDNDAGYLVEHQDLSEYAKKEDLFGGSYNDLTDKPEIPSIEGLATEEYVNTAINNIEIPEAELYKVDFNAPDFAAAIEAYNNGKLLLLVNAAPDANGYAVMNYVRADLITFTKFLTSRSEAYGSFNTYYLHSDNTWEVSKEVRLNKVEANVDGEVNGELTTIRIGKEVYSIPTTDGLASTEYVDNAIAGIEIPTDYVTEEELNAKGYITSLAGYATEAYVGQQIDAIDLSGYAKAEDIPTDYLTESDLAGYSKFSGSYNDLTDKPEIPSVKGLASEEFVKSEIAAIDIPETDLTNYYTKAETAETIAAAVAEKADKVPFTTDKFVGKAIGGFAVGANVKGLTIAEILAKLLELTDGSGEEPEEPTGIINTIITKEIPMYSVDNAGALAETPFKLIDGTATPVESGFYTKTDDQGNIIEAGYQDLQVENDEVYYVIALPKEVDYNTMVEVESYDPDEKIWVDADIALTSDPDVVSVLCEEAGIDITHIDTDKYTVWVQEDICTGSIIRYRIIEEN